MKNIDPKDVRPGMRIRVTVDRKIPDGSAIKSSITVYESTVMEAWVDGSEPIVTLANPGYNSDFMEDGKPMRVSLYPDSKQVDAVLVQQLDYAIDTIVKALTPDPDDVDAPMNTMLWIRREFWWECIGSPGYYVPNLSDSDVEQAGFEIVEIVYAPQVGA